MTITYVYGRNLYVNTTNRCDMSCAFCLRRTGSGVGTGTSLWLEREPSREEILEDICRRDWGEYDQLVFCGYGEPTYRLEDISWVIDRLRERGCTLPVRMDTNGHADLILGRDSMELIRGRFQVLSISLNAADGKVYQERCRCTYGEAGYEAMLDFTRRAVEAVPKVLMTVVDYHMTAEEIEACRKICEDLGAVYRVRKYSTQW